MAADLFHPLCNRAPPHTHTTTTQPGSLASLSVSLNPPPAGGRGVSLAFVNLEAEVKFGVTLALPPTYPAGPLVQQQAKIWFDGG